MFLSAFLQFCWYSGTEYLYNKSSQCSEKYHYNDTHYRQLNIWKYKNCLPPPPQITQHHITIYITMILIKLQISFTKERHLCKFNNCGNSYFRFVSVNFGTNMAVVVVSPVEVVITLYMHLCAWKWLDEESPSQWLNNMGNPQWWCHHSARHPAHAEIIDPRQLSCHWHCSQKFSYSCNTESLITSTEKRVKYWQNFFCYLILFGFYIQHGDKVRKGSWSYMKRDGSSHLISVSQSASSDGICSNISSPVRIMLFPILDWFKKESKNVLWKISYVRMYFRFWPQIKIVYP
jgi:hypothetical protein